MKELRIPLAWGTITAVQRGPENGPRFLMLHGWLDNAASFDPLMPHLPKEWNTVAVDLPGHGHSDHRPPGTIYHLGDAILDTLRVADHLGWETFSLLTHSLGGGIGSLLAGTFPEHVEKLVLLEALGPLSALPMETPLRLAELYRLESQESRPAPVYSDLKTMIRARLQVGGLGADAAALLIGRSVREVEGGYTWRSDRRLRFPTQRYTEEQVLAFFDRIRCPTLGIFTEDGLVMKQSGWEARAARIPSLKWVRLPGGHHLHMDNPETVAKIIREWI